jgi:hypothetical protein
VLFLEAQAPAVRAQRQVTRVHGIVIGEARIVYAHSSSGRADDAALTQSMTTAICDCAPLNFSARLGSAIAGQVLDIRFVGRSRATIVARLDVKRRAECAQITRNRFTGSSPLTLILQAPAPREGGAGRRRNVWARHLSCGRVRGAGIGRFIGSFEPPA